MTSKNPKPPSDETHRQFKNWMITSTPPWRTDEGNVDSKSPEDEGPTPPDAPPQIDWAKEYRLLRPHVLEQLEAWPDTWPENYRDFEDPVHAILNGVKGELRREMIRDFLASSGSRQEALNELLGDLNEDILGESIDESFTRSLTQIAGPAWMGGEYLPDLEVGEVEIARIVLQSVLMDVTVLRARFDGERYHYSMIDDNGGRYSVHPESSDRPLSLRQVIAILETADLCEFMGDPTGGWAPGTDYYALGQVEAYWHQQYIHGNPLRDCLWFASVSSEFYDLESWFDQRGEQWVRDRTDPEGNEIPYGQWLEANR
jgi:hypothetical protein